LREGLKIKIMSPFDQSQVLEELSPFQFGLMKKNREMNWKGMSVKRWHRGNLSAYKEVIS
jgi:hypothetical protein